MPPKITRVRWSAENIPWGLVFDENTGVFSGKPDDIGEYTVPVTVETNYGKDTKNVIITSVPPTYKVYAIGYKAQDWAGGKNEKSDAEGFYTLKIPPMHELYSWPNGFRAYNLDGTMYGCGLTGINEKQKNGQWKKGNYYTPNFWECETNPVKIDKSAEHYGVSCDFAHAWVRGSGSVASGASDTYSAYFMCVSDRTGAVKTQLKSFFRLTYSDGQIQKQTTSKVKNGSSMSGFIVPSSSKLSKSGKNEILELSQDKKKQYKYSLKVTSGGQGTWTTETTSLGFTAKKIIPTGSVTFLPENTSLAAELLEFPSNYGTIADAWYCDNKLVQTTDKKFYSYNNNINDWELLGEYDIKKAEQGFFLMTDGSLYHKGNSVSGVTSQHTALTHIFPTLNFEDFTLVETFNQTSAGPFNEKSSGYTLVVLKE